MGTVDDHAAVTDQDRAGAGQVVIGVEAGGRGMRLAPSCQTTFTGPRSLRAANSKVTRVAGG
jgi:hypothetical protein